jgi:hypothetical protein
MCLSLTQRRFQAAAFGAKGTIGKMPRTAANWQK